MSFKFTYRRRGQLFWRSRTVIGHKFTPELDRMTLYFENGALEEIPEWSKHHVRLGIDWVLAVKKKMESEAGQAIPLNIK